MTEDVVDAVVLGLRRLTLHAACTLRLRRYRLLALAVRMLLRLLVIEVERHGHLPDAVRHGGVVDRVAKVRARLVDRRHQARLQKLEAPVMRRVHAALPAMTE